MAKRGSYEDLTNKQFGDLKVLSINEEATKKSEIKKRRIYWNCQCVKCGNKVIKTKTNLKMIKPSASGCGRCYGIWVIDQKFGKLTVVEDLGCDDTHQRKVRCFCDCGNTIDVYLNSLKSGNTSSCGCVHRDQLIKRNRENSCWKDDNIKHKRLFNIWKGMKKRCYNPNTKDHHLYYDKGIKVCDDWEDWSLFRNWALLNGYHDDLTIDRIDSNGNYEPSNCRWVSMKVQANNTSRNKLLTYKGRTQTLAQWCDELNLDYFRTKARLNSCDYTVEEAFEFDRYQLRESTLEKIRTNSKCS